MMTASSDSSTRATAASPWRTNWGRWGTDDQRGAVNLINSETVLNAVKRVHRGDVIPLGSQVGKRGAVSGGRNKTWHVTTTVTNPLDPGRGRAEDMLTMHTHAHSHLDGLGHIWYGGQLYNGVPATAVGRGGARQLGIDHVGGIVTTGVLLDVTEGGARAWAAGELIEAEDLDRAAKRVQADLPPGAAYLVRTGWFDHFLDNRGDFYNGEPGFGTSAVGWLLDRDPAVVAVDNFAGEPIPAPSGHNPLLVHEALLRDHGIYLIELLNFRELAARNATEFLFVTAPLLIANGLGSPVNPLAVL